MESPDAGRTGPLLNRRGLLLGGAALAAGACATGSQTKAIDSWRATLSGRAHASDSAHAARPRPAPRAADGRRQLKKAVKIGMVEEGESLTEKFTLLAELGFDGVELESPASYTTFDVLAAKAASGLPVHGVVDSVHWSRPLNHNDPAVRAEGLTALQGALRNAAEWGASSVLLVPAVVNADNPYDLAWDRSLEQIEQALPLAEQLGVAIALENVWNGFLLSPLEARAYVDSLRCPQLGWYLDVGNLVNTAWPEQWVTVLGDRILKLDIKEYSRARRNADGLWKGFEVELLEGDCNWPAVLAALDEVGYTGWATAEIPGGDRARLIDIAARMDAVFAS